MKNTAILFLLSIISFSIPSNPLHSQPTSTCNKLVQAKQKDCFQKQYRAADTKLNKNYQDIKSKLPEDAALLLKKQSQNWIRYKEYQCGWQSEQETGHEKNTAVYFACLETMTRERSAYLKKAFATNHLPAGLPGIYSDAFGGLMVISLPNGQTFPFKIEVVRGPTAHLGEVEGVFSVKDNKAVFLEKPNGAVSPNDEALCKIDFEFSKYTIIVKESQCEAHHGARAYFDGDYMRIK